MIVEYYANPHKKVVPLPVTYGTTSVVYGNGQTFAYNDYQAKKKGIDFDEFVRRDKLVREKAKECLGMFIGEVVYPYSKAEFDERGEQRIVQIYRSYSDFENKDWDEDKWHFLVGARSIKEPTRFMTATPKYFIKHEPKD